MEIRSLEKQVENDLSNAYPNSAESYRHYIDGLNAIMDSDYEKAVEFLKEAYMIDSTFTFAAFYLAFAYNFGNLTYEEDVRWTRRAYELKDNLPPVYRPWIEMWYACVFTEDRNDIRRYCDMMYGAALHSRLLLLDLGVTYTNMIDDFQKAIRAFQKIEALNELWEDDWRYDRYWEEYAWTLLMVEKPEEALRIAEKGLNINPDDSWLKLARGAAYIMNGDPVAAKRSEQELRDILRSYNMGISFEEHYVGVMYCWAKDSLTAAGYFRKAWELDPERLKSLALLIACQLDCDINLEECLELAQYMHEKQPDSVEAKMYVGVSLYKLGRYEEALTYFVEADEMLQGYHKDLVRYLHKTKQALALRARQ
jgi:tetratricopeptide (TPR) repeat protein